MVGSLAAPAMDVNPHFEIPQFGVSPRFRSHRRLNRAPAICRLDQTHAETGPFFKVVRGGFLDRYRAGEEARRVSSSLGAKVGRSTRHRTRSVIPETQARVICDTMDLVGRSPVTPNRFKSKYRLNGSQ